MGSKIVLSILVARIAGREREYANLCSILQPQIAQQPVEVVNILDGGQLAVGAKRNMLLDHSHGEYVVYVDDDDVVEPDYVEQILEAIQATPNADCVEMRGRIMYENEWREFRHSISYAGWFTGADGIFYRTPNHLNPVHRDIAGLVRFRADMRGGEDRDYSFRIQSRLHVEAKLPRPGPLYTYSPSFGYIQGNNGTRTSK